MNPGESIGPRGPENSTPNPEQAPVTRQPEIIELEKQEKAATSPEIMTEENTHSQANPMSPPPPGKHQPEYKVPEVKHTLEEQKQQIVQQVNPNLPANKALANKKHQAKLYLAAALVFAVLFVLGLIFIIVSSTSSSDSPAAKTVNEQLENDLNAFALGVINFRNGGDYFIITPENVGRLKVSYIPLNFNDPRTNAPYTVTSEIPGVGDIQYIPGGVCNDDDSISQSGNDKNFASRIRLDNDTLLCIDQSEVKVPTEPQL